MIAAHTNMLVNRFAEDKEQIEAQLRKAVGALQKYAEKKTAQRSEETGTVNLLPDFETVTLGFSLNRIPGKMDFRFHNIPCPNPVIDLENKSACLLCRDPKEKAKEAVAKAELPFEKIICLQSLKRKYKSFESRRELAARFDYFFCEQQIYEVMGKVLGKEFMQQKKAKIPISLKWLSKPCFEKALNTARFRCRGGSVVGVRIGHRGMEAEKLVQNAMAVVEFMATKYCLNEKTLNNISHVSISATNVIDLPVWSVPVAVKPTAVEAEEQKEVVPATPEKPVAVAEPEEVVADIAQVPIKKLKQVQKQRVEAAKAELTAAPAAKKTRKTK